ncbi:MAG: FKBP-type peptidyl-prolyl cis-trans isomerase [Pseudobutyrivibrio sp.]|nr:FKBP-type peptidyl-prolyl cis-trans isomerase [Pseudobutyrivibrio sp.]
MKRKLVAFALASAMVFSLVACGEEKTTETADNTAKEEKEITIEYNVDDYVTLGDYKGIEVALDGDYEFTEEGFNDYVNGNLTSSGLYSEDTSTDVVAEDSIVNVDYVGSKDGVAFDGGSAEDQNLDIANNCAAGTTQGYIDGFCAGLVGHKVGEEVAYEVTFPDNYGSADLAGQTVVFTFQINYIAKAIDLDSLTDEVVAEKLGYDTVEEYMEAAKTQYLNVLATNRENDLSTAVTNAVVNNAKVSGVPEDLLNAWTTIYLGSVASQYNVDGEDGLRKLYEDAGKDYDEFHSSIKENIQDTLETMLVFEAVMKTEGIEFDEDEFNTYLSQVATSVGAADVDTFLQYYTVDGVLSGKAYFRTIHKAQLGLDFCCENAVVNDSTASEDE